MASAKRQHLSEDANQENDAAAIQELEQIQDKLDQVGLDKQGAFTQQSLLRIHDDSLGVDHEPAERRDTCNRTTVQRDT